MAQIVNSSAGQKRYTSFPFLVVGWVRPRPRTLFDRSNILLLTILVILNVGGCTTGEGSGSSGKHDGNVNEGTSLFDDMQIPFRAVVVTRMQKSYPLESLEIYGSPASQVAPFFKAARKEHGQRVAEIAAMIEEVTGLISSANVQLDEKAAEVAADYNKQLSDLSHAPDEDDPEYVRWLSKARALKSKAGQWLDHANEMIIKPIKDNIATLEAQRLTLQQTLNDLRGRFNDVLFAALPSSSAKRWVTDDNGYATLSVSQIEPWIIWSTTQRDVPGGGMENYRWILMVPEELDSSGKLFADHRNLFDGRGLVLDDNTGLLRSSNVIKRSGP